MDIVILILGLALIALLFISGAPMFVAFFAGCIPILLWYCDWNLVSIADLSINAVSSYTLIAIPLFVFLGNIMGAGGAAGALFDLIRAWVGHIRAGLGIATVMASAAFGTMCGSGVATALAIGSVAAPQLEKAGYKKGEIAAICAASGGLGIMIPPSVGAILLAELTGVSVARLFIAGVVPGLLAMTALSITCYIRLRNDITIEKAPRATWKQRNQALIHALPALIIPLVLFLVILMGIATPTEAAGVACVVGLIVSYVFYKQLTFEKLKVAIFGTVRVTAAVFCVIAGAVVFGRVLAFKGIPQMISSWTATAGLSEIGFLFLFIAVFFLLGLIFDAFALMYIALPVALPTAVAFGMDIAAFCMLFHFCYIVGQLTPPVCITLYAAAAGVGANSEDAIKKAMPYLIAMVICAVIVIFWPEMTVILPNLLGLY